MFDTTATADEAVASEERLHFLLPIARKRETPGDDLASTLIVAPDDGGPRLSEKDIEDIEVDGVLIRTDDAIVIALAVVGRDPHHHPDSPECFDVRRHSKAHLAFGRGVHFCLDSQFARLDAEVALPALFARFPDMSLAVAPDALPPVGSFSSNGRRSLPVRLWPA